MNGYARPLAIALCCASLTFSALSGAGASVKKQSSLKVNASVASTCKLTTQPLTFPAAGIGYIQAPKHTILVQTSLTLRCTKAATALVVLDNGLYSTFADASFGARALKLTGGSSYISYDLCRDSACAAFWNASGYRYVSPSDAQLTLPIWGRIVTGQRASLIGSYADSILATVNF